MYNPFKSKAWEDTEKVNFTIPEEPSEEKSQVQSWKVIARSYAAPVQHIPETLQDTGLVEKAMFGVTTILLQDELTGEIRREEIVGSDESQLSNILDKAGQFGMQYITYNGNNFAIALVPVEQNLPVV